ncbi:hypothetical protein KZ483_24545 [Paenibacillus sp. sptzw28]|uniref:hypothetical protein n=1 Tax=Paenibacillus sp. sptzw28 TaxID=715179 RepID=UPI001C6E9AC3|nr:hypothetical protein [Paenibacillus sp. sptzw28]QYR20886.1 hypothetical protein KZ483_24545 [Paenibacillus sp. sptzw28]
MELYFRDNFFNSGTGDIMNEEGESAGALDLKTAFGSSLDVYDKTGTKVCAGHFPFFSNKWEITGEGERLLGVLRVRMSFLSKRFEYDAGDRGIYEITAPAFSQEYSIQDISGQTVAAFARTSSWLQSGAFCLQNDSSRLDSYELVAVVMGVHAIQKRQRSS